MINVMFALLAKRAFSDAIEGVDSQNGNNCFLLRE